MIFFLRGLGLYSSVYIQCFTVQCMYILYKINYFKDFSLIRSLELGSVQFP